MDSFEWNKIIGAVLFACLVTFGVRIVSGELFSTEPPETPGYVIAVAEEGAGGGEGAAAPQPIAVLLATADPAKGETSAKKCLTCHDLSAAGTNKTGPGLYGVVMRPIASHEGYEYSPAMHAFAEQAKTWDYEHLNTFLSHPQATVPKTKMTFAGLKNDAERANVIAYLRTLNTDPPPLPEPPAQAASAEPAAPAAEASAQAAAPAGAAKSAEPAQAADAKAPAAAPAANAPAPSAQATSAPAAAPATTEQAANTPAAAAAAPAASAAAAAPASGGVASLIAAADPKQGQNIAKRCQACHSLEKDGPNKIGPHLWDVVNRPAASIADFPYSEGMKAFGASGKSWTFDELDTYLQNPKAEVPGNKMAFPGLKKDTERAAVIAYLRTLSDNPVPLPAK